MEFIKKKFQTVVELPKPKEEESATAFHWLLYKPQAHAIESFVKNEPTRDANTIRR
jgi:hypothetical protein